LRDKRRGEIKGGEEGGGVIYVINVTVKSNCAFG